MKGSLWLKGRHPLIAALRLNKLRFTTLQVQLHPHHLPLLVHLSGCLSASSPSTAKSGGAQQTAGRHPPPPPPPRDEEGTAPAARSIIEGMLLPDTTAVATEFLSQSSWGYGPRAGGGGARAPEGGEPQVPPRLCFLAPLQVTLRARDGLH